MCINILSNFGEVIDNSGTFEIVQGKALSGYASGDPSDPSRCSANLNDVDLSIIIRLLCI